MIDLLGLGSNAVSVYQKALATVSNNIANANSEGYTRQVAQIAENAPSGMGGQYFGTGARLLAVERQYDAFVERNLRNSTSDHAALAPFIDQTQRVLDQLGDVTTGLSSALDRFFAGLRELSADTGSTVLRAQVLSDAESLVNRFQSLDGFLAGSERDAAAALQAEVGKINVLSEALADVNQSMTRQRLASQQPSQLLDERDRLLRELAGLVQTRVREEANGSVVIHVGSSAAATALVEGATARRMGVQTDPRRPEKVSFVLEPEARPELLPGVGGGTIGGLLNFREQVLAPSRRGLEQLARTLVLEVNALHRQGIDATGQLGKDFFRIDPVYELARDDQQRGFDVRGEVVEVEALTGGDLELRFDPGRGRWAATDLASAEAALADVDGLIRISGLEISVSGNPQALTTLRLEATSNAAAGIEAALAAADDLALAAPLRLKPGASNLTPPDYKMSLASPSELASGIQPLADRLGSNIHPDSGFEVLPSLTRPVAALPAGYRDIELALYGAEDARLQIFTREGRQLSGTALSESEQQALLNVANGFVPGATYSDVHLQADSPYLGLQPFEGVRSRAAVLADEQGLPQLEPARLRSDRIRLAAGIAEGVLTLNGESLGALGAGADAPAAVAWINAVAGVTGVMATARNELPRVPVNDLVPELGLVLNGLTIGSGSRNADALLRAINEQTAATGVHAFRDADDRLALVAEDGADIELADLGVGNALGLAAGVYRGRLELGPANEWRQFRPDAFADAPLLINGVTVDLTAAQSPPTLEELAAAINLGSSSDEAGLPAHGVRASIHDGQLRLNNLPSLAGELIEIGLPGSAVAEETALGVEPGSLYGYGEAPASDRDIVLALAGEGRPSDLLELGWASSTFLDGPMSEELLVFVTGEGSPRLSATYGTGTLSPLEQLRSRELEISFGTDFYSVTDRVTGTELARRDWRMGEAVRYGAMELTFAVPPVFGDRFVLDANVDGLADNRNLLDLLSLEQAGLQRLQGRSVAEVYAQITGNLGNLARQAELGEQALNVVREQAEEARDRISGVSLDQEAADLIRFQQAYQAAARVIQTSQQLFDTIFRIA